MREIVVEISDEWARRLQERADELGLGTDELARIFVTDALMRSDDDFKKVLKQVIEKNKDLYLRLAQQ